MFLLQITINKKAKKLLTRNKIVESYNIIIDSFKNIFGGELKRENISFYYIFLRNQHLNELETYCINNKLPYMSYSIEKNKLVYSIKQVKCDQLIGFICKEYYLIIIKNSCN